MARAAAVSTHPHNAALSSASQRAGSPAKLAEAIGVTLNKVAEWIGGADVNPDVCPAIEQATQVRCDELRPDLVWVRDGADEVLGYVVPVDGADAQYVRQALAGPSVQAQPDVVAPPRVSLRAGLIDAVDRLGTPTSLFDDCVKVHSLVKGKVAIDAGGYLVPMTLPEAALLAETILLHRERSGACVSLDQWKAFAKYPHPLMPITFERGEGGVHASEIHVAGWDGGIAVRAGGAGMQDGEMILEVCGQTGTGATATLSVRMSRKEADTLAFALNGGNDGSTIAHVARMLCADVAEAIAVIERGELPFVKSDDLRQSLIGKRNALLDLCEGFDNHVLLRHGSLRQGRLPPREAVDRLAEAADRAREVMALHRGRLLAEGWKNERGDTAADCGFYADMRDVEKRLSSAALDVEILSDPPQAEVKAAPFRDPLEATAVKPGAYSSQKGTRFFNAVWSQDESASVEDCLNDASIATKAIENLLYGEESNEDSIALMNRLAQACIAKAHDKLIQFSAEGRRS